MFINGRHIGYYGAKVEEFNVGVYPATNYYDWKTYQHRPRFVRVPAKFKPLSVTLVFIDLTSPVADPTKFDDMISQLRGAVDGGVVIKRSKGGQPHGHEFIGIMKDFNVIDLQLNRMKRVEIIFDVEEYGEVQELNFSSTGTVKNPGAFSVPFEVTFSTTQTGVVPDFYFEPFHFRVKNVMQVRPVVVDGVKLKIPAENITELRGLLLLKPGDNILSTTVDVDFKIKFRPKY